jgi:hypothetical protein
VKNVMRSVAGAALSALVGLSMTGAASAGPMSFSSGSAISAALPAQVEEVRYYRRHVHYYRHHRYYRHYGGYDPGPAIAGAALGLMGAAAAGAARGGYDDYYGYPYGYYQPYGYGGMVAQRGHGGRRPRRAGPEDYRLCISKNAPSLQGIGHADVA